MHEAEI